MTNATYKKIDVVGTSTESIDAAIRSGISKAAETVKNLDWFEVSDIRGHITEGEVGHFQVAMKIGFRLD
ncbi:dodecin [Ruegeria sp. A3M17]|uniref:dodecin n=1 Tax=Ruegeria sp. A3M17 TaxID=2267229 RepID=UPI000DE8F224|nr:dodecin [Ruegeria sp. A3M17]RBW59093.1 dodecin family protein [Ruegeria sp. A3M17]